MRNAAFSFQQFAYILIVAALSVYILIELKFILAPFAFACLITLLLIPVVNYIERWIPKRGLAVFILLLFVSCIIFLILSLVSYQLIDVFQDIPAISGNLQKGVEQLIQWINRNLGVNIKESLPVMNQAEGINWIKRYSSGILKFFRVGLSSSTTFLFNLFLIFVATFFFLWHRNAIKSIILIQFNDERRKGVSHLLNQVQWVARSYLLGLFIVIGILAVLNSLGLWLIGIGHPIFLGSLASVLVIIPYIGTTIGGFIPFLYAIATASAWWQPAAVVAMYVLIQQIEGNFITPNVIGASVKINFFFAFIAIITGGVVWGISGIILALPFVAILKVICEHINFLKPFGMLMSDELEKYEDRFMNTWDKDQYRIKNFLGRNKNAS